MKNLLLMAWLFEISLMAFSMPPISASEISQTPSSTITGQPLADKLNARYQSTVKACVGGTPAYYCSGIIVRTTAYDPDHEFWTHSPADAQLGSLTFSYIRRDVGSNGRDLASGFIFSDQQTALAQNQAPTLRCIYPFMTAPQEAGRGGFGCGVATTGAKQASDPGTCAALVPPAITAVRWIKNFRHTGSNDANQCSLSTGVAAQFNASLEAHNGIDSGHTTTRNQLLIATWPEETPERLPIEAFFYDVARGGLLNAQALRHAYQLRTSQRIPIVRVDFSAADKNIFSWDEVDQVDGWEMADQLNRRYSDTSYHCDGQAAFYCNGVFILMTPYGSIFHSWNPNPLNANGVSFNYLRKDLKLTQAIWAGQPEQGYVFKAARYFGAQGIAPLEVMCSFAYAASSASRNDKGCGATPSFPESSGRCHDQGIDTLDQWRAHFMLLPVSAERYLHQCSFNTDQTGFAMSLLARENPDVELDNRRRNEIIFNQWPQDIPAQLAIEAVVYTADQNKELGLKGAKFMQRDYFSWTAKAVVVISMTLASGSDTVFSYHPSDQGL